MTPVSRHTKSGQVYLDLQKRARAASVNTDQLLVRYVLERFLYRTTQTPWQPRLILRGGMLLAAREDRSMAAYCANSRLGLPSRSSSRDVHALARIPMRCIV
jgi:hypothetical protein